VRDRAREREGKINGLRRGEIYTQTKSERF
jgi:hypothetical protein